MQYSIGTDIGGTNSVMGIVDKKGVILFEASVPTKIFPDIHDFIAAVFVKRSPEIKGLGIENFKGIGIGALNGNYYNGNFEFAPSLIWKGSVSFTKLFAEKFNFGPFVTNDENAF